jgi:uncharacterized protein YyaL (SSP411 family)
MKKLIPVIFAFFWFNTSAQTVKIYSPDANVSFAIKEGIVKAKAENKHIILQIGGNWCPWCIKFHNLCAEDAEIKLLEDKNFIAILVNYSKENRNLAALRELDYPQRFGFPVFVILNANGKRIHTQNSSYLEEGDGYSKKKVVDFLKQWSPDALNPDHYTVK